MAYTVIKKTRQIQTYRVLFENSVDIYVSRFYIFLALINTFLQFFSDYLDHRISFIFQMVLLLDNSGQSQKRGPPDPLRRKRNNERQYVFDMAFGADCTQKEVYEKTTQPLVKSVLDGFHATVFAYGATGM